MQTKMFTFLYSVVFGTFKLMENYVYATLQKKVNKSSTPDYDIFKLKVFILPGKMSLKILHTCKLNKLKYL